MRLQNQIIWITGSAKRVGKAIALACAREGADIVVHYRGSEAEARQTAKEIEGLGRRTLLVQGDHGQPADVARMVEEIREGFGRLTALVNSAAAFPNKPVEEISEDDFFSIVRTNTYGPFLCTQQALPLLREAKPGRVVNLTDWSIAKPYKKYAHYMASKGGLHVMSRALARELAPEVHVNEVAPGPVLEPEDLDPATRDKIISRIPLQQWGNAESVAEAVVFLLSNDNMCGSRIVVDGGREMG